MSETVILTPDSPWRGCSSKFSQPLSVKDQGEAQNVTLSISTSNNNKVVYRTGDGEIDIRRQVFRWDVAPYKEVFQGGLQVRRSSLSEDNTFYSLDKYVKGDGSRPLDSRTESSFSFISTTVSNSWYPPIPTDGKNLKTVKVYRYEIYAPGGIWVSTSLGSNNPKKVPRHDEVAFVGGIAPQYIRSAQAFTLTGYPNGSTIVERADNMLLINESFNPQSHPLRFLNIENPLCDYTEDGAALVQRITNKSPKNDPNTVKWYANDVADHDLYLSAAFRTSRNNEAYYILQNMVTQLYYDPGGNSDYIVNGPSFVSQMFKSLEYTPFGEHGIDAAFQLQGDEAIIFTGNLCVLINYAPRAQNDSARNDKILKGPMTIPEMLPLLKGTVFENGLDSAFESKLEYQYFLTKGNVCAHIIYDPETKEFELNKLGQIAQIIPLLKGNVFEKNGIDAAYGSHAQNEVAYLFQSNNWALLQYDLQTRKETIYGPQVMGSDAGAIAKFSPRKNHGLDMREDAGPLPTNLNDFDYDQVEPPPQKPPVSPPREQPCGRPGSPPHERPCGRPRSPPRGRPCGGRPRSPSCSPPHHGWGGPPHHGRGGPHRGPSRSPSGSPPWGSPPRGGPPDCGPSRSPSCSPPRGPHRGPRW